MNAKLEVTTTTTKEISCTLSEEQVAEILADWAREHLAEKLGSQADEAKVEVEFHGTYSDFSFDSASVTLTVADETRIESDIEPAR